MVLGDIQMVEDNTQKLWKSKIATRRD